jgi:transposase
MRAYSMDLRERVIAACDEEADTRAEVAGRFSVSESWVRRLLRRRREAGSIAPKPHGGQRPAFDAEGLERLRRAVADHPDAILAELRDAVGAAHRRPQRRRRPGPDAQKSHSTPPSRSGPTWRPGARNSRRLTRPGWSSSTRPGRPRR